MFSSRFPRLQPNALDAVLTRARASGARLLDLTETNPTVVGIDYPAGLLSALADPAVARYAPDPRGSRAAREAVAATWAGAGPGADQIVLTAGTSEAYGLLFRLLCDPGDEVLVPAPSYPLFELLTRFEAVTPVTYALDRAGRWCLDRRSLERALSPASRAVLVVSPNNPTGSMIDRDDLAWLGALCRERQAAIIADEVFAGYPIAPSADAVSCTGASTALTFTLGGLSKSAGLPQIKLAWIAVSGPDDLVAGALERLDLLSDTYLSVSTAAEVAAPSLIERGAVVRERIRERVLRNLASLERQAAAFPAVTVFRPEGGWSVVIRVPAVESEDALVARLVADEGVVVHPGYFFDFAEEAFLVISLLPDPAVFDEAVSRLLPAVRQGR
jgi:hypothetical protein